jgi:predicted amidohydrolase YtcJ
VIAGSSDAPVSDFHSLDGVRSALRRLTWSGAEHQPEEAISMFEALASYTRDAARVCGALGTTGTLEPGKRADLVVLNRDPMSLPASELDGLDVERTYLGGECVYSVS